MGKEFGSVIPSRGVHQGDPISPYIYILCAEGLSAMLRRDEKAGVFYMVARLQEGLLRSRIFFLPTTVIFSLELWKQRRW